MHNGASKRNSVLVRGTEKRRKQLGTVTLPLACGVCARHVHSCRYALVQPAN